MELPMQHQSVCFSKETFLEENFNVDEFVSQCRRAVTIETLKDNLDAFFRTLKSDMVELINRDYADFVNLSSNLVGMDKTIDHLQTPLKQLREEIMTIRCSADAVVSAIESKLAVRAEIRDQKRILERLIAITESVERLERLLKISGVPECTSEIKEVVEKEEFADVLLERISSEYNNLQYNTSTILDHPIVENVKPRIAQITETLQNRLESDFKASFEDGDKERLAQTLQAYAAINRQGDAEAMFRSFVRLYMQKVVSPKTILTHPQGLSGMFSEVLKFVPHRCSLLLEVAYPYQQHGNRTGQQKGMDRGFDFITNSVWPEIVSALQENVPVIFSVGNPDNFHKNYSVSMEFLCAFEGQCPSQAVVKHLRTHPSFASFMGKWNLSVYFQIRFQEIAGSLENCLQLPLQDSSPPLPEGGSNPKEGFHLELFCKVWSALERCWSKGVFLPALVHRFWKLSLQLFIRTSVWLEEAVLGPTNPSKTAAVSQFQGSEGDFPSPSPSLSPSPSPSPSPSSSTTLLLKLIHDCEKLVTEVPRFFTVIEPNFPKTLRDISILRGGVQEALLKVKELIPRFSNVVVEKVGQECIKNLEPAHTVPRLYRRTNKERPTKPSSYVGKCLKPLRALLDLADPHLLQYQGAWKKGVIAAVTNRYHEVTSEVLTSVKRTEDSLLKLKRNRRSQVTSNTSGMSDDNKIRLQLALDIEQYLLEVSSLQVANEDVESLVKLSEIGQNAKAVALAQ